MMTSCRSDQEPSRHDGLREFNLSNCQDGAENGVKLSGQLVHSAGQSDRFVDRRKVEGSMASFALAAVTLIE